MVEKLKLLLAELRDRHNIDDQQALKYLICDIKDLSIELHIDFDLALDKSEPYIELDCQHGEAFPCGVDSVFCPICNKYIIEGKVKTSIIDWVKQNHWRTTE